MNRTASLLLAMVLAALGAAVWLLTREDSGPGETPRLTRPAEEEPGRNREHLVRLRSAA